jgi:DNA-binding response OmpR family regulator
MESPDLLLPRLQSAYREEAAQISRRDRPAVMLLDLMLPGIEGVCVQQPNGKFRADTASFSANLQ